jgi:hypothetical protein
MRICISEYGFKYICYAGLACLVSCFITIFLGSLGFFIFIFSFLSFLFFVYVFRISTVSVRKAQLIAPCDGIFISQHNNAKNDKLLEFRFESSLFDQYAKFAPCDGIVTGITKYEKNNKEFPKGVKIKLDTHQFGSLFIIIWPDGFWGSEQNIEIDVEIDDSVKSGDILCYAPFGSNLILILRENLELERKQQVIGKSTILIN